MPQIAQQDYIRIDWEGGIDTPTEAAKQELLQAYKNGTIFDVIIEAKSRKDTYYSRIIGVWIDEEKNISVAVVSTEEGILYVSKIGSLE